MTLYPGFIGPFDTQYSVNVNTERTINLYYEARNSGTPAQPFALYNVPGVTVFANMGAGITRCLFEINGRLFVVWGDQFGELSSAGVLTTYGLVQQDEWPATMASNGPGGDQVMVTSGGFGYIFDLAANTFVQITDPEFPTDVVSCEFLDGYFIALQRDTSRFFLSALEDGLLWDGLDFAQVSQSADIVRAMIVDHRQLFLFGGKTTAIWYNSGSANFPFEPTQNLIQQGIGPAFSVVRLDNTIFWIGENEHGGRVAYTMQQFTPQRISTHAVEGVWNALTRVENAVCWSEVFLGHAFYHVYLPDAETSWVYDVSSSAKAGQPIWTEWALWNTRWARWEPWIGRCHAFAFGKHLVGDRRTGVIYEQRSDVYTDEIVAI